MTPFPRITNGAQMVNSLTASLSDREFIAAARKANQSSIANTATGAWLDAALGRLAAYIPRQEVVKND